MNMFGINQSQGKLFKTLLERITLFFEQKNKYHT